MISPIHIIGHLNPDTGAIASALGYAWLLRERDGLNALSARAGAVTLQTAWALRTAGLEPRPTWPTPRRARRSEPQEAAAPGDPGAAGVSRRL